MTVKNLDQLLREYVRLITEEGEGSYGYGGMVSYTQNLGDFAGLLGLKGIMNVGKTALAQSKIVGTSVKTGLKVVLQTVLTTLIPVYGYNYAELFDKEKAEIKKIKDEYRDVYRATDEALGGDAALLAFFASPALVLGAVAVNKGPEAAKSLLSAASLGISDDILDKAIEKLKDVGRWAVGEDERTSKSRKREKAQKTGSKSPGDFFGESALNEDDSEGKKMSMKDLVSNKKLVAKALGGEKSQKLQQFARETYQGTLKAVYAQAKEALASTQSVDALVKHAKKDRDKLVSQVKEIEKGSPEEKALLDAARKSVKDLYVKNLTKVVDDVVSKGVPESAQFVKDYRAVIQKIASL
jgi:hypothetical protein